MRVLIFGLAGFLLSQFGSIITTSTVQAEEISITQIKCLKPNGDRRTGEVADKNGVVCSIGDQLVVTVSGLNTWLSA